MMTLGRSKFNNLIKVYLCNFRCIINFGLRNKMGHFREPISKNKK